MGKSEKIPTSRIVLIFLAIFIVGPLVFFGACFPVGMLGFMNSYERGGTIANLWIGLFFASWIIGLGLAIYVVIKTIKAIKKYYEVGKIDLHIKIIFGLLLLVLLIIFFYLLREVISFQDIFRIISSPTLIIGSFGVIVILSIAYIIINKIIRKYG
ncbi:MAG: hypothetical protein WC867_03375 [Candidatus Pacearchaeota archaeon]|jgi:hypothetical protein